MFASLGLLVARFLAGGSLTSLVTKVADVYSQRLAAGETHEKLAADLAARQIALDQREAELQAQLAMQPGSGYIRALWAVPPALYFGKLFVWDKFLGLGVTDPIDDRMFWIAQTVVISYFGNRAVQSIAEIFKGKV